MPADLTDSDKTALAELRVAIFSGPMARQRALDYAEHQYGQFEEAKLEPYR